MGTEWGIVLPTAGSFIPALTVPPLLWLWQRMKNTFPVAKLSLLYDSLACTVLSATENPIFPTTLLIQKGPGLYYFCSKAGFQKLCANIGGRVWLRHIADRVGRVVPFCINEHFWQLCVLQIQGFIKWLCPRDYLCIKFIRYSACLSLGGHQGNATAPSFEL